MSDQWINIDEIINGYLTRAEESNNKFYKCWQICFDGMTQLGLDFFYKIKSIPIMVASNKTAVLPSDYLMFSKVGVFNGSGAVIPLVYNSKLSSFASMSTTRDDQIGISDLIADFDGRSNVFYNYNDGYGSLANLYGIPSGSQYMGTFKIEGGQIILDPSFGYAKIVLEYVSSPETDGAYYVPVQFKEVLMWYIAWQAIAMLPNTRKGSLGDKEQRKSNYYNERRLAKARYKPLRLDQEYLWHLDSQRYCVKF